MSKLRDKIILITGGASGIGKIMGQIVLSKGAKLIIWDINQSKIDETVSEFQKLGNVSSYKVDVSNNEEVQLTAKRVKQEKGIVDVLINNAGIVVGKYFHEHTKEDILRTININTNAPMFITQEFLPDMMQKKSGHVCNIASSAGLISNPKMSIYAASKWAVIGWSDSLRLEMKELKNNVGITTVTPYYINTGMFDGVKSIVPILNPEKVAKKIIRAIEKNKPFLSMPWNMRLVRFGQGVFPIWFFDWFVGKLLGIYNTMNHFEGHKK